MRPVAAQRWAAYGRSSKVTVVAEGMTAASGGDGDLKPSKTEPD